MGGNNEFFENFERNKYLKKLPACKELSTGIATTTACKKMCIDYKATFNRNKSSVSIIFSDSRQCIPVAVFHLRSESQNTQPSHECI